ncbi:hypothetical protein AMECASPLE_029328 [Ameca splendens]|uniref:Secreted protein n=1 Tax=Ameca splendens TaxID=208324 RepID=A0ABV0Y613_9TELE
MGSVSESMTSIVICLYVGCVDVSVLCIHMRVGMCDCDCVPVFCVRLGLGLLPPLDQFRPPIKCGAYFLPTTLPACGWCLCPPMQAGCFGVCCLIPGGCLLEPGPLGSVGPLLGE